MISCIRITRACVAGHPILGELAGTVKRKRRAADRKLVAGCYLSDRRRKVNRQRPQRKAMSKPRRRHDASRLAFGETRRGEHFQLQRSEKSKAEQQAHIHEGSRAMSEDHGSFFRCQTAPRKYSYIVGGMVSLCSLTMCLRTISE